MTLTEHGLVPPSLCLAIETIARTALQEGVPVFHAGAVYSAVRGHYSAVMVFDALDYLVSTERLVQVAIDQFRAV